MPKKSPSKPKKTIRTSKTTRSKVRVVSNPRASWLDGGNKRGLVVIFVVVFAIFGIMTLWLSYAASSSGPIVGVANKCLDNKSNTLQSGNPMQLFHCNGTAAQKWTVTASSDKNSKLVTIHLGDKYCLDVKHAGTSAKTPVWLWACNATVAQQWVVNSDGSIVNPNSGLCLDDKYSSSSDGNPIWMWPCNGTAAQKWTVPKTTSGSGSTTPPPGGSGSGSGSGGSNTGTNVVCNFDKNGNLLQPSSYVKPTAANTGVPAGKSLTSVTPSGGTLTISKAGTVIDGQLINGNVEIKADNVTIQNSKIIAPTGTYYAVHNEGAFKFTMINSEVTSKGGGLDGIDTNGNTTICGVNAHGFENIGSIEGDNVIFQSNYFHINQATPGKSDPHNDVLELRQGKNDRVLGNNLTQTNPDESWQHNTSAFYGGATWGQVANLTVDNNWFGGGAYSFYLVVVPGYSGSFGSGIKVTNNKWYRGSYAYGPTDVRVGVETWSNNVYADNGQAVGK